MRKTIALINWKGGTCKTTVTLNAGAGLASLGKRTLVIDLDPQGNLTYSLGIKPAELRATIAEALEGKAELEDAIIEREGMDIIPATQGLADTESRIVNVTGRENLLRGALGRLKRPYDFILIDGPPSLGLLTTNALAAAREVFVPLEAQALPLQGLKAIQGVIELVRQRINPGLELSGIIAARAKERMMAGKRLAPSQISGQGKTDKNLASIAGVSHDTIHKAKIIAARAELALKLEPIIAAKAKEKQKDEGRALGGTLRQKSDKGAVDTKRELASIAGVSHDTIHKAKIIAAKYDGRLTLSREVMETLRAHFGDKVFKAVVRAGVKLAEAPSSGKSIFTYAPHSHAAEDYLALCKEIIKRSN